MASIIKVEMQNFKIVLHFLSQYLLLNSQVMFLIDM